MLLSIFEHFIIIGMRVMYLWIIAIHSTRSRSIRSTVALYNMYKQFEITTSHYS